MLESDWTMTADCASKRLYVFVSVVLISCDVNRYQNWQGYEGSYKVTSDTTRVLVRRQKQMTTIFNTFNFEVDLL